MIKAHHLLFTLALALATLVAAAQTAPASDAAVWISSAEFEDVTLTSVDESAALSFEERVGWGVSYNRLWVRGFSTELAYHRFGAGVDLSVADGPAVDLGEIDATALIAIAQWHFRREARFRAYVGAGLAYLNGAFTNDDEAQTLDFAAETELVMRIVPRRSSAFLGVPRVALLRGTPRNSDEPEELRDTILPSIRCTTDWRLPRSSSALASRSRRPLPRSPAS